MKEKVENRHAIWIAAAAAFATYFCMYAFRKPFTAATYEGQQAFGVAIKSTLILSQLLGYTLSKFIGIKVVSELDRRYRPVAIVGLIAVAELALVLFALLPNNFKVLAIFFNGLPLGMVFGLVLSYLEGRRQTEALSSVLCASFIISSGVVKSVGQWLIQDWGVGEFYMPMITGLIFLFPLLISVWLLQKTPPPDKTDVDLRQQRREMFASDRRRFFAAYWPGLCLLVTVYIFLTVVRTIRDDYGVEIWRDLGIDEPSIFAISETFIAILVLGLNGVAICFRDNLYALRMIVAIMCAAFLLVIGTTLLHGSGMLGAFAFMVLAGAGLYFPYVAFHTTVFERILAASRIPGNLAFLMYLADSIGYLGYAIILTYKNLTVSQDRILPTFTLMLYVSAATSIILLIAASLYFNKRLSSETTDSYTAKEAQ